MQDLTPVPVPVRVFAVEDDPDLRAILSLALGPPRFVCRVCAQSREAVAQALRFGPDIMLLDVMMPFRDGPATLAALRRQPALAAVPVVFMTARVLAHEREEYRALGAREVIAKPFDPTVLGRTLLRVLGRDAEDDGAPTEIPDDLVALFRARLPERLAEIERAIEAEAFDTLFHLAHRLTGSAASLGFPGVRASARAIEDVVVACQEAGRGPGPDERQTLGGLLLRLREAVEEALR